MRGTSLFALPTILLLFNLLSRIAEASTQSSTLSQKPAPSANTPSSHSQHLIHPAKNDVLVTGGTFNISWTIIPSFTYITIQLWDKTPYGFSRDLLNPCLPYSRMASCGAIATHAPNNGSFEWRIPVPQNGTNSAGRPFPRGEKVFWVKILVEDFVQSSIGNTEPVLSLSQSFAFAKDGESGTIVSVDVATLTTAGGLPLETVVLSSTDLDSTSTGQVRTTSARPTKSSILVKNGTASAPAENIASKMRQSLLGAFLLLLDLI